MRSMSPLKEGTCVDEILGKQESWPRAAPFKIHHHLPRLLEKNTFGQAQIGTTMVTYGNYKGGLSSLLKIDMDVS